MFRTVPLPVIRSSFTVHSELVYVIQFWRQLSSRTRMERCPSSGDHSYSCSKAVFKTVWHTPVPSVQWMNSWWWAEELPETCRVSFRSKFVKLVHLVGFIIKKFVTLYGHMDVKSHMQCFENALYFRKCSTFAPYLHDGNGRENKLNIYLIISEYKLHSITRDIPLSPTKSKVFCLRSL
jgi:hypothetical protein